MLNKIVTSKKKKKKSVSIGINPTNKFLKLLLQLGQEVPAVEGNIMYPLKAPGIRTFFQPSLS